MDDYLKEFRNSSPDTDLNSPNEAADIQIVDLTKEIKKNIR